MKTRGSSPYPLEESELAGRNLNLNSKNEMDRAVHERNTEETSKSRKERTLLDIVDQLDRGGRSNMPSCYHSLRNMQEQVRETLDDLAEEQDTIKDKLNNLQHLDVGAIQETIKTLVDQMNACSSHISVLRAEQETIADQYKGLTTVMGKTERVKLPSIFQTKQPLNMDVGNHSQNASKVKRSRRDSRSSEDKRQEADDKAPSPAEQLPSLFKTKKQIKAERRQRIANRLRQMDSYDDMPVYVQTASGAWRKSDRTLGEATDHHNPNKKENRERSHKKEH